MPLTTIAKGLTLQVPTPGTTNWSQDLYTYSWVKISEHDHSGSGKGLQLGTSALSANSVTTAKLSKNYGFTVASTLTPTGTTTSVDFDNGNIQIVDLGSASGNVTATLSNFDAGHWYYIWVKQGATVRELSFSGATIKWENGQAPILSTDANALDLIYFCCIGSELRGFWALNFS